MGFGGGGNRPEGQLAPDAPAAFKGKSAVVASSASPTAAPQTVQQEQANLEQERLMAEQVRLQQEAFARQEAMMRQQMEQTAAQFEALSAAERKRAETLRVQQQRQLSFFDSILQEQQRVSALAEQRAQRETVQAREQQQSLFTLQATNQARSAAQRRAQEIRRRQFGMAYRPR